MTQQFSLYLLISFIKSNHLHQLLNTPSVFFSLCLLFWPSSGVPEVKVQNNRLLFIPVLQYVQRRQQENAQRQSRGEPPLPEEDLSKMFKPPQPPPRMDTLLIASMCRFAFIHIHMWNKIAYILEYKYCYVIY